MRTAATLRRRTLAACALILLAAAALADRDTATFQAGRGDKALSQKKWEEAEGLYRKALEEDGTYLPARHGLAQALLGAGKSAPAVEELRAFVEAARAVSPLPAEWKGTLAKAEKQLADLDAAGNALQKIVDEYADDLVALAGRWTSQDPVVAERALRRALEIRPNHAKAGQLLERMGKSLRGEPVRLFDGKSLSGWVFANAPIWQAVDGELVATCRDSTYNVRTEKHFAGDFDVRIEARLVEEYSGDSLFMLEPCWKSTYDRYTFGIFKGRIRFWDTTSEDQDRDIVKMAPTDLKERIDVTQWNTYEARFRGDTVTVHVNGEQVGSDRRPENRRDGFVGLLVQNAKAAFRKVEVEMR